MKTILVAAGHTTRKGIPIERQAPLPTESLGLACLATAVEQAGFEVVVLDGYERAWSVDETITQLLAIVGQRDLVGFSVTHAATSATRQAVYRLRRSGFDGPILLGGWEATLAPRELLAEIDGADWIVRGEGEVVLPELIGRLDSDRTLEGLPGLLGRDNAAAADGRANVVDFASQAPPRHHALDADRRPLPIQSSRGCAFGACRFCTTAAATGRSWRAREPRQIVAELAADIDRYGATERVFVDDEFLGPSAEGKERALALADALTAAKLPLRLTVDCRVADFEPRLFDRLQRAGVGRLFLGIESGSDAVLRRWAKGYTAATARCCLRQLRAAGFEIIPGYILFEPFMSLADLRAAFDFLVREVTPLTPTKFLNQVVPYVGTGLHAQVAAAGLLRGSYPDLSYRFADPALESFFEALKQQARGIIDDYKQSLLLQRGPRADRADRADCADSVSKTIRLFDRLLCAAGV